MKRLLVALLLLVGFFVTGCEEFGKREDRDVRLSDGQPLVEVTVQQ